MKLKDALEAYYIYSDQARSLALFGIAIIWVFKVGDGAAAKIEQKVAAPLLALVVALALDIGEYALSSIMWGGFNRWQE